MHEIRAPLTAYEGDTILLSAWHVRDGETVAAGQALAIVETAKASVEVTSPADGVIHILAGAGEHAPGTLLARIAGEAATAAVSSPPVAPRTVPGHLMPMPWRKVEEIRALGADRAGQLPTTLAADVAIDGLAQHLADRDEGPPLSLAAVVVHELARALPEHPLLNARYLAEGVYVYDEINVGVAIDALDRGLRVPVIRNADRLGLDEIAAAMQLNLYRYLRGELTPDLLTGATVTVSDLTPDAIPWFVPLIPRGQVAILGLGLDRRPASPDGDVLRLVLTVDHRVADGRLASALLGDLTARIARHVAAARRERPPRCASCGRDAVTLAAAGIALLRSLDTAGGPAAVCAACALRGQSTSST